MKNQIRYIGMGFGVLAFILLIIMHFLPSPDFYYAGALGLLCGILMHIAVQVHNRLD